MADTTSWISLEEAKSALLSGTGRGVKIAILDTGIETSHPDLKHLSPMSDDLVVTQPGESFSQIQLEKGTGNDVSGHGTAVASILHQVAPEAQVGSFRVLNAELKSRTTIITEGVRLALDKGYHLLNCSFACLGTPQYIMPHKKWVDQAYLQNVHVVAASNNDDIDLTEWPGFFSSVITVGMLSDPSLREFRYRAGHMVDFLAPGRQCEVAWKDGSRVVKTGSSYAVPYVAGHMARILSVYPDLSPPLLAALLRALG